MKPFAFALGGLSVAIAVFLFVRSTPAGGSPATVAVSNVLKSRAADARKFVGGNNFNRQLVFIIDFSISSGQPRFFVYDLGRDSVLNAGLVTHGRCNQEWLEGRKYGNTVGCGCSSPGKYKIGKGYKGRFGQAWKLHGLDSTNSNAFDRFVVLHSHECVPESGTTEEICQSDGCPTVSPNFLQYLKPIIDRSDKPILLWAFDK
ncbi:MAG: hypothetical protein EOO09_14070 [Chitinophagaceae bacterium]|nr:MAG: hypothetical protein EOO09_14070 [Chitinophagaceae bacterium]